MAREYDFSQLTHPLSRCTRAFSSPTVDGRYKVYIVQHEGTTLSDVVVYIGRDGRDARDAAIEISDMIKAARMLVP